MKVKKMQLLQLSALMYFIMRAGYLGIGISGYLRLGKVNAYLCPLIGGILGIIPLLLYLKLSKIIPKENINGLIRRTFKKGVGSMISLILALFVAYFGLIILWDLNHFIASEYLYNTPILAIVIMLIIPIIYILIKGVQTLGRSAIVLFFISFFLYLLSILGLINQIKITNILPFLEDGMLGVWKGTFLYISYSVLPIYLLLIIPRDKFQQVEKMDKFLIITYITVTFFITLVTFILISVLGIDLANLYQYPDYHLLRRITIGNFIQRAESLLAIQWVISLFMLVSLCFYYVSNTIEFVFEIGDKKKQRFIILAVSLILMYLSTIIFRNNTVFSNFTTYHFPILIFLFLLVVPIIIYIFSKILIKQKH